MKFSTHLLMLLLIGTLAVGCSSKKSKEEGMDAEVSEVSDDLLEDDLDGEVIVDEGDEELIIDDEGFGDGEESVAEIGEALDDNVDAFADEAYSEEAPVQITENTGSTYDAAGEVKTHVVRKNETLMLIAWNIYGDYTKWRDIARLNSGAIRGMDTLEIGMKIKYRAPAQQFVWNPEGDPYLIIKGDTLGLISNKVYGSSSKWKSIWNNNRPLIRDPNLIFAGFTIYYLSPDSVALK